MYAFLNGVRLALRIANVFVERIGKSPIIFPLLHCTRPMLSPQTIYIVEECLMPILEASVFYFGHPTGRGLQCFVLLLLYMFRDLLIALLLWLTMLVLLLYIVGWHVFICIYGLLTDISWITLMIMKYKIISIIPKIIYNFFQRIRKNFVIPIFMEPNIFLTNQLFLNSY